MVCYVSLATRTMNGVLVPNSDSPTGWAIGTIPCCFCHKGIMKGQWRVQIGSRYWEKVWAHLKCMLQIPKKTRPETVGNDVKIDWKTIDAFAGVLKTDRLNNPPKSRVDS